MLVIILNEIEQKVSQLSHEEQLWLIERFVRRLRENSQNNSSSKQDFFDDQLAAMANDPEIQAELRQIDEELRLSGNLCMLSKIRNDAGTFACSN